jgi:hypothetical protein
MSAPAVVLFLKGAAALMSHPTVMMADAADACAPAWVNKFVIAGGGPIVKISFLEHSSTTGRFHFRAAVVMTLQDADELRRLLAEGARLIAAAKSPHVPIPSASTGTPPV